MVNTKYVIGVVVVSFAAVIAVAVWGIITAQPTESVLENEQSLNGPLTAEELEVTNPGIMNENNPTAIMATNKGNITLELFTDRMPITTENFISLAENGFYDNTKFHRVIDGFMIQGGDPNTRGEDRSTYGRGGPDTTIQDEFVSAEHLTNVRGTVAMANTGQPNSGGSQFFINTADNTGLDFDKEPLSSKHPVFGRVIAGMDVVNAISAVTTDERDIPEEPVVIESITIDRSSRS